MPNTYVNKVELSNGDTLIDITDTTAVADDVAAGKEFYLASGAKAVGTGSMGAQSDWEQDDTTSLAHVLNRPAIRAGEGTNSIVEGQIEESSLYKEYKLYITGEANATTFTYTTEEESLPANPATAMGYIAYCSAGSTTASSWQRIKAIDETNNTITLYKSLSTNAISNVELLITFANNNKAISGYSHSEGMRTVAAGSYSHAEGRDTLAAGGYSHAEGNNTAANGNYSHTEGYHTIAVDGGAHAEGNHTIAHGSGLANGQHVEGKYNIEDPDCTYAHIVGNGTSSARSNAHTLDWSGNGWYAGKLTVGAAPTNDMDVATKQYVDQNAPVQSDWSENDSTDPSYIQNRTHYKTSIGYILPIDLIDFMEDMVPVREGYTITIDGVEHAYAYGSERFVYFPDQIDEWNLPNGGTDADLDLTATSVELVVDGVVQTLSVGTVVFDGDATPHVAYYNDQHFINTLNNGELGYSSNYNTQQSLILRLPMANECFEYTQKLDSNYLDGGLIVSGAGYKSEIFNGTEGKAATGDYSHAEGFGEVANISVTLTGDANATEYQFSDNLSYYDIIPWSFLPDIGTLLDADYNPVNIGFVSISLNGNNGGHIEFTETLDAQNALVDAPYYIALPTLIASGSDSHAEGYTTTASGNHSHAEGSCAIASGSDSHAEGYTTTASGSDSHAEGYITTASGNHSHAEGNYTTASADYSHAEGSDTTASGDSSHAEGSGAIASGHYSHAEGNNTTTSGTNSHAEGYSTTASGGNSHAEGYSTTASGVGSHAEGYNTIASGFTSHVEGGGLPGSGTHRITLTGEANATTYTVSGLVISSANVLGILRYIVGLQIGDSKVTNQVSDANTGVITSITVDKTLSATAITGRAFTLYSGTNTASGRNSHAEGTFNYASGNISHVEGIYNTASYISHAEGYATTASGTRAHSEGYFTIAQRRSQHVFGEYNLADTGGTDTTTKGNYIEIVGNGTADATRSNARTLDWSGNEVLAGKLTVGAGPVNNMDVATKQYVDENASGGDASIAISSNVITLTNASGQTSSITLPVYSGAVSGGAS